VVEEVVVAADAGSQVEAATRTLDEPTRAVVADTLAEAPTDIATPAGPTLAEAMVVAATTGAAAITEEELITVEEVITEVAATGITAPGLALGWASTAHPTATAMVPDIAARPGTMISMEIGSLRGAPHIPTKHG
jgi:hypothetical protein